MEWAHFSWNGKPFITNGLRFRNPPFWLVICVAVAFNKVPLFS